MFVFYPLWRFVKSILKIFGISEERLSFFKERFLLIGGFFFNKPLAYRHHLPLFLNFLHIQGKGVEIGVREGSFSEIILEFSRLEALYSVDPWKEFNKNVYQDSSNVAQKEQDARYAKTLGRLKKFGTRSEVFRMTSEEAVLPFSGSSLDFIYIDANHSYEGCKRDIEIWWPKLKQGGIFAGHDYCNGTYPQGVFGVKKAVDEFVKNQKQSVFTTPETWPTWYCVKNAPLLANRFSLLRHLLKELSVQYKNPALWRTVRGIH